MNKNIKLFLDKIVIGDNITGMLIALNLNAIFIPVSFLKPFSWDHSSNIEVPALDQFIHNHLKQNPDRTISSPKEIINVKYYDNELYSFLLFLLKMNSLLLDNFAITTITQKEEKTINVSSKYGIEYIIDYNNLYVVNPSDWFFSLTNNPVKRINSKYCHLINYVKISKNTSDMKGVLVNYDTEDVEGHLFNRVYNSSPFGQKRYIRGYSPYHKTETQSTRNICFITNNLSRKDIKSELHSIVEYRKEIYKYLSVYSKRVAERYLNFEEDIERIILSTDIDLYTDSANTKFIYYEDKEEIICQNQFQFMKQSESFQQRGLNLLFSIINSTYFCQSTKT